MSDIRYTPPTIVELGSVHELTQAFNKIGATGDQFSPQLVGSLIPAP